MKMKKKPGAGANKKKDKKLKKSNKEQEPANNKKVVSKTAEQRYPFIRVEGVWSLPSSVKIVNAHVKVIQQRKIILHPQRIFYLLALPFIRKMILKGSCHPD